MHILVCDDDAAFSAKVAEYAATYFEAHEIPVQATVCSDPEQVLAIPDLELYRIAFLDVDMPQVNGIALGGQLRHRNPDICLVYVSAYLAFALDGYKVNAYRYILKRDVAKQLPSCLEDIYASMMQAGTRPSPCTTTARPFASRWTRSIIWRARAGSSMCMGTLRGNISAPFTAS